MPTSTQESSSGRRQSAGGGDPSPSRYPPPYDVLAYTRNFSAHFDTQRFTILPTSDSDLTGRFSRGNSDTAVVTWRKRREQWAGRDASTLRVAFCEINSPFLQERMENGYKQRLAALLADVRHRSTVATLPATDCFCLAEDFRHLYFLSNRPSWAKSFHFKARVRDCQSLFAG